MLPLHFLLFGFVDFDVNFSILNINVRYDIYLKSFILC
jgi:hypothetical protein